MFTPQSRFRLYSPSVSNSMNRKARELTEDKFTEFYKRFAPRVYSRCLWILADEEEALDAVQDIFLKIQKKLATFRGDSGVMTWIYRVSTNHCLNKLRDENARRRALTRIGHNSNALRSENAELKLEQLDLVVHLMGEVSRRKAQIVFHRFFDEMTHEEIARVMGISDRAVRKTIKSFIECAGEKLAAMEQMLGEKT